MAWQRRPTAVVAVPSPCPSFRSTIPTSRVFFFREIVVCPGRRLFSATLQFPLSVNGRGKETVGHCQAMILSFLLSPAPLPGISEGRREFGGGEETLDGLLRGSCAVPAYKGMGSRKERRAQNRFHDFSWRKVSTNTTPLSFPHRLGNWKGKGGEKTKMGNMNFMRKRPPLATGTIKTEEEKEEGGQRTERRRRKGGGNDIETRESKVGRTTKVVTFKRSSLTFLSHLLARTRNNSFFFARARKKLGGWRISVASSL